MTIPDKLVTAAATTICDRNPVGVDTEPPCGFCLEQGRAALAAAFAALPEWVEEELSGSIVSGVHPQWFAGFDYAIDTLARMAES